jgi:GNAT superfamily N-acetyltransferase
MASEPKLILTDRPSDAAQTVIDGGLAQYNEEQAGYRDWRDLAVLVTDPNDAVRGGLLGRTSLGLFFVDLVYLPPEMRRSSIGSRVFAMAEEEVVRRGCVSGALFTISFQAPGFYSGHGWREIARIPCLPAARAESS